MENIRIYKLKNRSSIEVKIDDDLGNTWLSMRSINQLNQESWILLGSVHKLTKKGFYYFDMFDSEQFVPWTKLDKST